MPFSSVRGYYCRAYEGKFITGAIAGAMTRTDEIGYIASYPILGVPASINAFALGAQMTNPEARIILRWSLLYTVTVWFVILLAPGLLIRVFSDDPELLRAGSPALRIYFSMFVFQALQYNGQNVFRSLGRKRYAIFFSLFRKVIMVVPLTLLLPGLGFGVNGVFFAEPVSNLIGGGACFVTMMLLEYRKWQET